MNVEKTMEFILEHQAQFEVNFAKAEKRLDPIERRAARTSHLVARLATCRGSRRSGIRRRAATGN